MQVSVYATLSQISLGVNADPERLWLACRYNSQVLQLFVSSLYLAAGIIAPLAGIVANRYGRKVT